MWIPFCLCQQKFSFKLSMIIVLLRGLPSLDRSLTQWIYSVQLLRMCVVCYLQSLCLIWLDLSSLLITSSAYSYSAAVKITNSQCLAISLKNLEQKGLMLNSIFEGRILACSFREGFLPFCLLKLSRIKLILAQDSSSLKWIKVSSRSNTKVYSLSKCRGR